ncbi:MAG: DUF599 domain-containing protein [Chromatiaceae bacterium]|nr:DUF599 domain-containing protein [Chromatiaceae bacterium]
MLITYSDLTLELALSGSAGGLLIGYHLIHLLEVRYWPARTSLGRNNRARARWASNVMARGADILAVQTLRNWTMAATFLASTAIVIGLGILSFALTYEGLDQLNNIFHIAGIRSHKLAVIKALLVVLVFLIAFVSFSLCVRFYNHAAFLLNLPRDDQALPLALPLDSDAAIRALSRGASAYNLGMRCYYVAIPLALWLLGPIWFLAGALVMTMLIYRLDHGLG